jgi:hypothetical protein
MQNWIDQNFLYIFPVYFAALWVFVTYWVALLGGWRLLAKRFRMQRTFLGAKWNLQSAQMRWMSHYNNALTIGADHTGLFIVPLFLFRLWHPPLFIPWTETSVRPITRLFFFKFVELRLGRQEAIPFAVNLRLAARIEAAAGPGWPLRPQHGMELPPPPIG